MAPTSPAIAALPGTHITSHQCLAAGGAGFPGGQSSQIVAIHKDFGGLTACGVKKSVLAQDGCRVPGKKEGKQDSNDWRPYMGSIRKTYCGQSV